MCCDLVARGEVRCCDLVPGGERCCDLVPGGGVVTFGVAHPTPPPPPTGVEVTHACENITFSRFAMRAVTTVLLKNGLQLQSGVTPLLSMRTVLLASLPSCRHIDADTLCKWALNDPNLPRLPHP